MIDIHNHIIFDFDDGPKTRSESLDMLRRAADQGITDVFATSHFTEVLHPGQEDDYFKKFRELRRALEESEIPVKIHSGGEMFFHHFLERTIRNTSVATLANQGRYVLMEFPLYLMPTGVEETLFKLSMDNIIPIVAHPERYSALHDKPDKLLLFIKYGALLQVNTGSVLGEFGRTVKRSAMWLLENQYVHFLGSDAHRPEGRGFSMDRAARELEPHLDPAYIRALTLDNPRKIIDDLVIQPITVADPEPVQTGLLGKMKRRLGLA